jgi:TolB-like protein
MSGLFEELKRRNVVRVGIAYVVAAWLLLQVADLVLDNVAAPDWVMQVFLLAVAIGFPIALIFAWAFEATPEGIKREKDVDRSKSITPQTGRRLDRAIIVILIAAVALLLTDKFLLRQDSQQTAAFPAASEFPVTQAKEKSVAVLPFKAMSRGPDDEYFADGLTEEILNALTQLPELLVTARTSAFHFKDKDLPIQEIAGTLGVNHIVEGSVRRDGERIRITAQLIRANDGFHLWSNTYDRTRADSFAVQTDIAEKVAAALDVVLDEARRARMRAVGLQDPEAFVAYQKGRELFDQAHGSRFESKDLAEANVWFELATRLVPSFSDGYLNHADYYTHLLTAMATLDQPDVELLATAADAAERQEADYKNAVRFAQTEEQRLNATFDLAFVTGKWRGLSALIDQVLVQPGCASPAWLTVPTYPFGRIIDVLEDSRRNLECNPLNFRPWQEAIRGQLWLGDFDAAVATAREGLQKVPHEALRNNLGWALIAAAKFDEAEAIIDRDLQVEGNVISTRLRLAATRGDQAKATSLLEAYLDEYAAGDESLIAYMAIAGDRQRANETAAKIDGRTLGYMVLLESIYACNCGAPFDLDVTPNFARMLDEAELSWPPASPIDWPLKDW